MAHYKPSTGAGCNLLMNVKPPSLNIYFFYFWGYYWGFCAGFLDIAINIMVQFPKKKPTALGLPNFFGPYFWDF